MPLYEHVFLTRQDASAQQVEELTAQFKAIIEQMGGKVAKTEQWGVKSLAYRLRKNRKAHFTLFNIDAPPASECSSPLLVCEMPNWSWQMRPPSAASAASPTRACRQPASDSP